MLTRQLDQKERPTNKLAIVKLDWRRRFGASRIIVLLRQVSIEHRTLRSLPRLIRHTSMRDRQEEKNKDLPCYLEVLIIYLSPWKENFCTRMSVIPFQDHQLFTIKKWADHVRGSYMNS